MSTSEKQGHSGFVDAFPSQYGGSIIRDVFFNDASNPRPTSAPPTLPKSENILKRVEKGLKQSEKQAKTI